MNRTIDTILRYTVVAVLLGVLFVPLVKMSSLFFPFITGKGFLFRTLVEIGLFAYVCLILRDKSYLPKKSSVLSAVIIFTAVLGLANITSVNPARSFWSNYERMEGYVTILHLFVYFVLATTVLRTRQMWHVFFNISLAVSIAVGISGFMDYSDSGATGSVIRIAGTLGNSTYLGIYSLLHAFIGVFMISQVLKKKYSDESISHYLFVSLYSIATVFNLIVMYNTGTRGSVVGLGVSIILGSLLIAIFERKNKILKNSAIGVLIVAVVSIVVLGLIKNTEFVKERPLLERFSSLATLDISSILENQGRARSLLWGIAAEGVKERPILGWGQENFGYVFAKYYNPEIYDQEQWFDRTHNVFMDWLISGGVLGLISYLALFVTVLYVLWRKREHSEWSVFEKSLITALLTAYFIHNIFVFDNLTSYLVFFAFLAYVASAGSSSNFSENPNTEKSWINDDGVFGIVAVVIAAGVLCIGYNTVLKPYEANRTLINGLLSFENGASTVLGEKAATSLGRLSYFKDALAYDTFGRAEINERLSEAAAKVVVGEKDRSVVEAYISTLDSEYKDLIAKTGADPRPSLLYGVFLQKVGLYDQSIEYFDSIIKMSPKKQSFYYQKGLSLIMAGRTGEAVTVFKQALDLLPSNREAKVYYGIALLYDGRVEEAKQVYNNDLDLLTDPKVIQTLDSLHIYSFLIEIAKMKVNSDPENAQWHVSLAAAYMKVGQNGNAIAEIRKAIELEPRFKEQGEGYIKQIQSGVNPTQ